MSCTRIIVYNLPEEARNRLGSISEAALDVYPDFSIRQSKQSEELNSEGKIVLEGAERFSVPGTYVNDAILTKYHTPLTLDNRQIYMDCRVYVGNTEAHLTRLYVIAKNAVPGGYEWELELRRPADHWAELGQALTIDQIDYGKFTLTAENLIANWDAPTYAGDYTPTGDTPTYWALLDFGGWVDQTEKDQFTFRPMKAVLPEDFRPLINLVYLLKRGACQIGWTLDGVILDTAFWRSVSVYILNSEYWKAADAPQISGVSPVDQFVIPEFHFAIVSPALDITDPDMEIAASGPMFFAGCQNKINGAAWYCFRLFGKMRNNQATDLNVLFDVGEVDPPNVLLSGEVLSTEDFVVTLPASSTTDVVVDIKVLLQPGQKAALFARTSDATADPDLLAGFRFVIQPCNESFVHGQEIEIARAVRSDMTWMDWMKIFLSLTNGKTETDWNTKTITVHPNKRTDIGGEIVPGFLREENTSVDISALVLADSVKARPIRPNLKRYTRLQFADSSDAYIESLGLTEPPYSRKIINGEDLPDEIEEIAVQYLEPTMEGGTVGLRTPKSLESLDKFAPSPYIPRLWDNRNDDGSTNRSFDIEPRIFYNYGLIRQINPEPGTLINVDVYAGFYFDGQDGADIRYYFGYASQLRTWEIDPAPAVDGNLVFGNAENDLFVSYYLSAIQNRRGGMMLDALLKMRPDDYSRFDFRDLFSFRYEGRPLRVPMREIRDFAGCEGTPTPVVFLAEPAETGCCDLPCSCRFTTCEFYMDLGPFLRQSTLDSLAITSFTVDDVQYITSPVSLGPIEIVNIAGRPYITNLWKTLNALGVPYFTFSESSRIHPERGARYFKLKRPACQGFVIEVSFEGDVVYRYTDTVQETAWFGAVFGDFGYGSLYHGEPIDCFTTVEY